MKQNQEKKNKNNLPNLFKSNEQKQTTRKQNVYYRFISQTDYFKMKLK